MFASVSILFILLTFAEFNSAIDQHFKEHESHLDGYTNYDSGNFGKLEHLGVFTEKHTLPPKIIRITKTVGFKVPVPYPVKIPHTVVYKIPVPKPYPVHVPKIVKVKEQVPVDIKHLSHGYESAASYGGGGGSQFSHEFVQPSTNYYLGDSIVSHTGPDYSSSQQFTSDDVHSLLGDIPQNHPFQQQYQHQDGDSHITQIAEHIAHYR